MTLRSHLGKLRRAILCAVYRRNLALGNSGPVVSFTFDDFPRSASTLGASILEAFGARGTYYVTAGLMGGVGDLGEMCEPDDLRALRDRGHELGTQTFHHSSSRSLSLAAFKDDVRKGVRALEPFAGSAPTNFAYPYGHVTVRSKKYLGPELTSSRSTVPGLNGPNVDLNLLRANRLYGGDEQIAHVERLIQENLQKKAWLIFYTHDIRPNPSEYGCTPQLFEFAVKAAAQSGARILTVQNVLAELGMGIPETEMGLSPNPRKSLVATP
jgi:peptidoglycan/xylan/chitin deacetylase (PgdA/CDA1 family)